MANLLEAAQSAGVQQIKEKSTGIAPSIPVSSNLSQAAQASGVGVIPRPTGLDEQPRETSFFKNVGQAFGKRLERVEESLDLDQSFVSDVLQFAGQGAGLAWDIVGEALSEFGRGVSHVVPDIIEKPVKQEVKLALETALNTNTPLGPSMAESIIGVEEMYDSLKETHPTFANNLEAIVNLSTLTFGGKLAKKGVQEVGVVAGKTAEALETRLVSQTLDDAIRITAPKLTTIEKSLAIKQKRGTVEGIFRTPRLKPSAFDEEVAKSVQNIVDIKNNPFKNIQLIDDEIKNISITRVEQNLLQNNSIFNRNQLRTRLSGAKEGSRIIFGTEKTQERIYDAVIDAFMLEVEKQPKTLAGLWQARKNFDTLVEIKFGKGILSNPVGDNVRKNAIRDVRRTANDFIENKLPDNISYKGDMQQMTKMYKSIDNIADKAAASIDKDIATRVKDAILKHPLISTLTGSGIFLGLASGALYSVLANPVLLSSIIIGGITLKTGRVIINSKTIRQGLINLLRTIEQALQKKPKNIGLLNDSRDVNLLINQIDEINKNK